MATLILGLGNELLADEGVGIHAVRRMRAEPLPDHVTILEVGTAILDALDYIAEAERIIVIDAMKADGVPGTVYKIPLADCQGASTIASMHGFDIHRVMALAGRSDHPGVMVFGVEPAEVSWSLRLSEAVAESLEALIAAVVQEFR